MMELKMNFSASKRDLSAFIGFTTVNESTFLSFFFTQY